MNYSQFGSWTAIAGIIVVVLAHFGITIDSSTILTTLSDIAKVVGDIMVVYGIIHQFFAHKRLAVAAGAFPR